MSGRWFRFYADALRNPKVARLSDAQFRLWVELLAVSSDNDGLIPCLDDLKHLLRRRLDHLSRGVDDLINAGLIDPLGDGYEPHNWSKFQYKSDTSTPRVSKHRAKRNVSVTSPETDTEADKKGIAKAIPGARDFPQPDFADDDVWRDFLTNRKKKGLPNTATAHAKLLRDIQAEVARTGWPPGQVLRGCVERGWAAIYEIPEAKRGQSKQTTSGGSVTQGAYELAMQLTEGNP